MMGWSVGYDTNWKRDIGYGVPATCDYPGCNVRVDRGLGHVCGWQQPQGGEEGCGLFFCAEHGGGTICDRCEKAGAPYTPSPDVREWIEHKLTDASWAAWRDTAPAEVAVLRAAIGYGTAGVSERTQDGKPA